MMTLFSSSPASGQRLGEDYEPSGVTRLGWRHAGQGDAVLELVEVVARRDDHRVDAQHVEAVAVVAEAHCAQAGQWRVSDNHVQRPENLLELCWCGLNAWWAVISSGHVSGTGLQYGCCIAHERLFYQLLAGGPVDIYNGIFVGLRRAILEQWSQSATRPRSKP